MSRFPCRLLLDFPNWLGDFVHALPALEVLLAANRHGATTWLVPPGHLPLARFFAVEAVPRPRRAAAGFGRRLRGFDVVLTFRHSTRAKLLVAAVPGAERWASRGRGAGLLGLATFPVDRQCHQRHDFDHALTRMGLAPVNGEPGRLPLVRQTGGPKVRVALLPGSMVAAKRYPAEGYLHVARGLARAGYGVTVFVGPREVELGKALSDRGGLELFPPSASLDEVAAALAGFSLAIGNDSGLTHLASAVGCPTLALFGPTDPERTAPARGTVLMARGFATRGWKGLPPEAVLATAETLLAGGLQDGRKIGTIPPGGGPLAQLAEQGTLNP